MNRKSRDDPISWDFVFVLTRFHDVDQISRDILSWWPDFMGFRFSVDSISRCWPDFTRYTLVITEILIFVIISPHNIQPVCVLYVCAAIYSGRSHTGTRLSLLICCSKWLVKQWRKWNKTETQKKLEMEAHIKTNLRRKGSVYRKRFNTFSSCHHFTMWPYCTRRKNRYTDGE